MPIGGRKMPASDRQVHPPYTCIHVAYTFQNPIIQFQDPQTCLSFITASFAIVRHATSHELERHVPMRMRSVNHLGCRVLFSSVYQIVT
jgi:hypothetical protein